MMMKIKIATLLFPLILLLSQVSTVFAAGGGDGHGGGGVLGIDIRVVIVQAIGFLIVFLILKRFLFTPLTKVMDERRDHIRDTLSKIESDRTEMEQLKSDYESRISKIEDEARAKIQEAVKRAEEIGDEIKSTRREEAEQMLEKARAEIEREHEKSLISLRQEVAELALQMSGRLIQSELDKNKHRQLIDRFINELETNVDAKNL